MGSIPADIWRHIAQFMSQDDLRGMISVNSTLFDLAMGARYRFVSFAYDVFGDGPGNVVVKKLQRLREPAIAPRVRCLYINFLAYKDCVLRYNKDPSKFDVTPDDIVRLLIDTVSLLVNVTEFNIVCLIDTVTSSNKLLSLLTAAWKSFGCGLRKLSLRARLQNYEMLLRTVGGTLPVLQELDMDFLYQDQITTSVTSMAQFLSEVAPTLRSLSFISPTTRHFDHHPLFNSLTNVPNLVRLEIEMRFDSDVRGLSGLDRILCDHTATLRHFKWLPHWHIVMEDDELNAFVEWMKTNMSNGAILSNLQTLEIFVPPSSPGFDLAMGYIQRSATTLTSLSLSGAYFSQDKVDTVASIFTHRGAGTCLEKLSIHVESLSLEVVLTLAQNLPQLYKLRLVIKTVTGTERDMRVPENAEEEIAYIREFEDRLRKQDIRSWQLNDIGITVNSFVDSNLSRKLVFLFAECVPSIRRCRGVELSDLASL